MIKSLFVIAALVVSSVPARAENQLINTLNHALLQQSTLNLIDWKIGDSMAYNIKVFGSNMGTSTKAVTREEGNAIWMEQSMALMGQNQKAEALIDRATGKILKYIVNGKEQTVPDEALEIISQDYVDVTVPAGTFKSIHIVAKSESIQKMELWANPSETCMDGALKTIVKSSQLPVEITLELTSFRRSSN